MNKIRIGHIGTLHDHSEGKLGTLKLFPDVFEIVGVVPESQERWDEIKDKPAYKDVKMMTEDELFAAGIDAAIIESFELDLIQTAQRCVDRGIPVHIDKPAGEDIDAFEHLLKTAKAKDITVQMAYMYRYNPKIIEALEKAKSGELGEIYAVEAHMDCEHPKEKRDWLGNFNGGMMFFLGCHLVDLIALIQGVPEEIISYNTSTGIGGTEAKDYGMAVFKYKNGVSFAKSCAAEPGGFPRRQLVICGSKGTIEIKPLERYIENGGLATEMLEVTIEDTKISGWGTCGTKSEGQIADRYGDMMLDFAKCVRGEKKNQFTYEYELMLQKLVLNACGMKIDFKKPINL